MSASAIGYRADVDGLRGVAILLVVFYHLGLSLFSLGYVGVDVFFVISGFVIARVLIVEAGERGAIDLKGFYARRVRRLFPAMMVVVVVTLLLGVFFLTPMEEQQDLGKSAIATAVYISNFYFMVTESNYFGGASDQKALLHTWSLGVEEQFYLILPPILALVLFAANRRIKSFLHWSQWICFISTIGSFVIHMILIPIAPVRGFFFLPSRWWELGLGVLIAFWITPSSVGSSWGRAAPALVALALISAAGGWAIAAGWPRLEMVAPVVCTALLIAAGHHWPLNPLSRALAWRPAVLVGLVSYSLYLWHWPLLSMGRAVSMGESQLGRDAALLGTAAILAILSHRYLENPIRFQRPLGFRTTNGTLLTGVVMSTALIAAGAMLKWHGDMAAKQDKRVLKAYAAYRDFSRSECAVAFEESSELTPAKQCTFGPPGKPVGAVLWGDSHANALSPTVETAVATSDRQVLQRTNAGCPPLLDFKLHDSIRPGQCERYNQEVRAEISEALPDLQVVVLAAQWNLYSKMGGERPAPFSQTTFARDRSDMATEFYNGLVSTLRFLSERSLRVVIARDVPALRYPAPICALRKSPHECSVLRKEWDASSEIANSTIDRAMERFPNVEIWDPTDFFCDETRCFGERNGTILYVDTNHVTSSVARDLGVSMRLPILSR